MSDRKGIAVVEATAMPVDSFAAPQFEPILTDADDGHTFTMLGTSMRFRATAASTGGRYTVLEQVTPPGWGPPRHIHSHEDEILYILEGSYEFACRPRASDGFRWRFCHLASRHPTWLS